MEKVSEKAERRYSGIGVEESPGPLSKVVINTPSTTPSSSLKVESAEVVTKTKVVKDTMKAKEMGCDLIDSFFSDVASLFGGSPSKDETRCK